MNIIKKGEIGLLYDDDPINEKKTKGIILEIETKFGLLSRKHKDKIWLSMKFASLMALIPRNFGNYTEQQIQQYINKNAVGKSFNFNLTTK